MSAIRLTQLDGKLPNLALMKLSYHHRQLGDEVYFTKQIDRSMLEPPYHRIYGSAIFSFSTDRVNTFKHNFPEAIIGGTYNILDNTTVEQSLGIEENENYDYSIYPNFDASIGFTQRGCRLKCGFCILPGGLIITADGLKSVEQLVVGDIVLTHRGRYRKVTETMHRWYSGLIYRINGGAISNLFPIWVTGEHPVYTRRLSYRSGGQKLTGFNWKNASDIQAGHHHRSRDRFAYPRTKQIEPIDITPNEMTLIGWYLAEGYLSSSPKRGIHRVTYCLGHSAKELEYAHEIQRMAASVGLKARIGHPKVGIRVTIESVKYARWLAQEFGTGSVTKTIPLWVRLLSPSLLHPMIESWCCGDGWEHIKKGSRTCKITTVSPDLAVFLREIVLKCGYTATINRHISSDVIQGRKVNVHPAFTVIYHEQKSRKSSTKIDIDHIYGTIEDSDVQSYSGFVYNFEVEEDHSYCTPNMCLHNCVVPKKEGKPRSVNTIATIWRGEVFPRHLHLLDNDFFGQPREQWEARLDEIRNGDFRVCLNQGINTRMIDDESAKALASVAYYDDSFKTRRLYTAWDNIGDEGRFFKGVDTLERHGIPPHHLLVYMLVGYDKKESWERILYRFNKMVERKIRPYPMVFGDRDRTLPLGGTNFRLEKRTLGEFQRWAIRRLYEFIPFEEYSTNNKYRIPEQYGMFT